jgi:anti-sigma regulatory factor (Ser/Thr protein kinase)
MIHTFTMMYPSVADSEDRMLDDLGNFLDQFSLDPALRHGLTLCLSEAFTNALKHGNQWDRTKKVYVNVSINAEAIVADITDEGRGGLAAVQNRPRPEVLAESGRGIDFIYRFCPAAELSEVDGGGLRVRLTMKLKTHNERTISR